jgi:hypothetical protein
VSPAGTSLVQVELRAAGSASGRSILCPYKCDLGGRRAAVLRGYGFTLGGLLGWNWGPLWG